ncbi:MAG: hypothetical protein OWS74_07520 [Firmicutes bacterium]|nr:hypothetical protein [Bacillota bacterium]
MAVFSQGNRLPPHIFLWVIVAGLWFPVSSIGSSALIAANVEINNLFRVNVFNEIFAQLPLVFGLAVAGWLISISAVQ